MNENHMEIFQTGDSYGREPMHHFNGSSLRQIGRLWRWRKSDHYGGLTIMKLFSLFFLGILSVPYQAFAVGSPAYAYLRVYAAAVSTSEFCTNPIVLFDSPAPREVNMFESPTIGGGTIPDGTYRCMIMKISDTIRFRPAADDGTACLASQEYNLDVCRAGTTGVNPISGGTISCTGATLNAVGSDTVFVFLSTTSTNTVGSGTNAFTPPTSTNTGTQGMNLANPFVVSGSSAGQFVMDLTDKVDGTTSAPSCDLLPPIFKFR
jgi:hypothetical protein